MLCTAAVAQKAPLDFLRISPNSRYLVHSSGAPFLYLGDTAWELFHRLNRKQADTYLTNRRDKGFTVIQAAVLAELDGLRTPNAYGDVPLTGNDPSHPNEAYFKHVDYIVGKARERCLYIAMLPTWGDKVVQEWGRGPVVFNPGNARAYGKFLGARYKDTPNIIWIVGGDRWPSGFEDLWREMARGLKDGDGGKHLITCHVSANDDAGHSSSEWFHSEPWLDMNMIQTWIHWQQVYQAVLADYRRTPHKPVIMGEPRYEGDDEKQVSNHDLRKQVYWAYLAGAAGFTYGRNHMWQMDARWQESLDSPVAFQVSIARKIFSSRRWWTLSPDQSVFAAGLQQKSTLNFVSGISSMADLNAAARSAEGDCIFIYISGPGEISVHMDKITSTPEVRATWVNPLTGAETPGGTYPSIGVQAFTMPASAPDAVLLLDAVSPAK